MIISASRRTDIPAFYSEWFMNRIRAGFCRVTNPFNPRQVGRISLEPGDVDAIVFWTRNPRPLLPHLQELEERGYRYVFQYTLLDYPRAIEGGTPPLDTSLTLFRELSCRIGPERITWRYDPILATNLTDGSFHRERYEQMAEALRGSTQRSVFSIMEGYRKVKRRLKALQSQGIRNLEWSDETWGALLGDLARIARKNGMTLSACAQQGDLSSLGIERGRCIDAEVLSKIFDLQLDSRKDPSQRPFCGCSPSKDIGAYDTCVFGCVYCYATSSLDKAKSNRERHDPREERL